MKKIIFLLFLPFINGCLSLEDNQPDGVSTYILSQRLEKIEAKLKEVEQKSSSDTLKDDVYDSINKRIISSKKQILLEVKSLLNNQEQKNTKDVGKELESKVDILTQKIQQMEAKNKEVVIPVSEEIVNVIWITMKNKSKKAIRIKKEGTNWTGPSGEIYEELPTEKELKLLYSNN